MKKHNDLKILFKFATKNRPDKFFKCLDNILEKMEDKNNYQILVSVDNGDLSMLNKTTLTKLKTYLSNANIKFCIGDSRNKVEAINRDIDKIDFDWDILINTSDDMMFTAKGFDNIIRKIYFDRHKNLDQFTHFPDGFTEDKICTMSIMGRKYYKRTNCIYNPEYNSLWCDNEATEVAKMLGKYSYYEDLFYIHEHPNNVSGIVDELLVHTESYYQIDKITYDKRKANNFGI